MTFPAYPGADDLAAIGIRIVISAVVIDVFARTVRKCRGVRPHHLGAEIESCDSRNLRQIDSGIHQRALRGAERRCVIVSHTIVVENQPVAQPRDAIAEIEAAATVAYVGGLPGVVVLLSPKLLTPRQNIRSVTGRKTMVRENPSSRFGVGLKLTFCPSMPGSCG